MAIKKENIAILEVLRVILETQYALLKLFRNLKTAARDNESNNDKKKIIIIIITIIIIIIISRFYSPF